MDFNLTPELENFRGEFVEWLDENIPDEYDSHSIKFDDHEKWKQGYRKLQQRLFDAGYAGMHYPKEYGGQGKGLMHEAVVLDCLSYKCDELRKPGLITHSLAAPTILHCGNEAQKKFFLPKILDGSHVWCQGFSEPDAGSDIANLSTRAEREGDYYIVNGQKVWTTFAQIADYCILVARTNPDVPKHLGLSYLLVDMNLPGIEVRPLMQISGDPEFNEVFFDNVKVPVDMLVGEQDKGWQITLTTLMFERALGDMMMPGRYLMELEMMIESAKQSRRSGKPAIEDPLFRQQIGQAYIDIMVLKSHSLRNLSKTVETGIPGPEGSIGKLLWSEPHHRILEDGIGIQGMLGAIEKKSKWGIQPGYWQFEFFRCFGDKIAAGTSQIQRNIIGERVLGLPK
jgi:alkylation response protein AidB-like acyl-CoA dehydrogenase